MGKAKKPRHRVNQPYNPRNNDANKPQQKYHIGFLHELSSLEESKRKRALSMLSSIYSQNTLNIDVLSTLTLPETLSKLSLRLLDTSMDVRTNAAGAIRNLSICVDETIVSRIYDSGILRTLIQLSIDPSTLAHPVLEEQVLHCLCNIISSSELSMNEVVSASGQILQTIASIISDQMFPMSLRSIAANLLLIASDDNASFCRQISSQVYIDQIYLILSTTYLRISTFAPADSQEALLFVLRCSGVLINLNLVFLSDSSFNIPNSFECCHIADIIQILISSLVPNVQGVESHITKHKARQYVFRDDEKIGKIVDDMADDGAVNNVNTTDIESASVASSALTQSKAAESSIDASTTLDVVKLAAELLANLASSQDKDEDEYESMNEDEMNEEINYDTPIISQSNETSQIGTVFKQHRVLSTLAASITSLSQPLLFLVSNIATDSLTSSFVDILEVVDTLASTATNLLTEGLIDESEPPATIAVFIDLLSFAFDAVQNTSKSIDKDGNKSQIWQIHDSVSYPRLLNVVMLSASSASQAFSAICKYVSASDELMNAIALVLMKGVMLPVMEVVVASIESVSQLATHNQISTNINFVLTNCLLRRSNNSSSFSAQGMHSAAAASALVQDAALIGIIDLHSGDALDIFHNYISLNTAKHINDVIASLSAKAKDPTTGLAKSEKNKIKETILNGKRFLKYKEDFAKTLH